MEETAGKPERQDFRGADAAMTDDEKHRLLSMSEISLWLDCYDDIFSDFDPRPYSQRALSQDFLEEAQRASRGMASGSIVLKLLIPESKRNTSQEATIKKRLKEHFRRHYASERAEVMRLVRQGAMFTVAGIAIMFIAALVLFMYAEATLFSSFLIIFLEPAGWFLFWEGLNLIIFESKKLKPGVQFYRKMSECEISFMPY